MRSNQVEIIYSSSRNSKETGEIIRISPRESARGIRPLGQCAFGKQFIFCFYNLSNILLVLNVNVY